MPKAKQTKCSQWMAHKWLPTRAEIKAQELTEATQQCKFCGEFRTLVLVKAEGEEDSQQDNE